MQWEELFKIDAKQGSAPRKKDDADMPAASSDNAAAKADVALRLSVINTFHLRQLLSTIYLCSAVKIATPLMRR